MGGTPAILVGLGGFGADVARAVARDQEEAGLAIGAGGAPAGYLSTVTLEARLDPDAVAATVLARAREALAHPRVVAARDLEGAGGATRLHVLVLGHLGDDAVRERIGDTLAAIEKRLLGELSPIFEPFRTGATRNGVVLPLLAMPHPAAHARGAELARGVRALARRIAETPSARRAIPQLYLIEDVAEFSVLSPAEMK